MNEETTESKKPKDSKFRQQRLPAWQPILTAQTVLPIFAAIGISFIPIGVALLLTSNNVKEIKIEYTNCEKVNSTESCAKYLLNNKNENVVCSCIEEFEIESGQEMKGDVYLYYGLTNFYQNHRRYVKSRDDDQLLGETAAASDCEPYRYGENNSSTTIPVAPCGAIANSFFQDRYVLSFQSDEGKWEEATLNGKNIAWSTDRSVKFKNPSGDLKEAFKDTAKPKKWLKPLYELDPTDADNNGYQNEDLIVWMRTAALPTFRKLHRKIDLSKAPFKNNQLAAGKYKIEIDYSFEVTSFSGKKFIILTTTSWMGGKNPFLGVAYIVTGSVCIILAMIFFIVHIKIGKNPIDLAQKLDVHTEY